MIIIQTNTQTHIYIYIYIWPQEKILFKKTQVATITIIVVVVVVVVVCLNLQKFPIFFRCYSGRYSSIICWMIQVSIHIDTRWKLMIKLMSFCHFFRFWFNLNTQKIRTLMIIIYWWFRHQTKKQLKIENEVRPNKDYMSISMLLLIVMIMVVCQVCVCVKFGCKKKKEKISLIMRIDNQSNNNQNNRKQFNRMMTSKWCFKCQTTHTHNKNFFFCYLK